MHSTPLVRRRRRIALSIAVSILAATIITIAEGPQPAAGAVGAPPREPTIATPEPLPQHEAAASVPIVREQQAHAEAPPEPAAAPDFAAAIDELCRLGIQTAEHAQQDEFELAQASDAEARRRFETLLADFADAGERALAMLVGLEAGQADLPRRMVLQLVLTAELQRRHAAAAVLGDRAAVDGLVDAVLGMLPSGEVLGEVGTDVLDKQPFLRLAHEPRVLELVRLAGAESFPRPLATRLLLTLWDNLQQHGERSGAELAQLSLLLLDGGGESERAVAARQLLRDPRYRPLVLAMVRERGDHAVADQLATVAARELDADDALQVLRELQPVLQRSQGAYLTLAMRAPDSVATAYQQLLADDQQPGIRRELVAGVGLLPNARSFEIAQLALDSDPDPAVRLQALFVFTVHAEPDRAEQVVHRLLDDPAVVGNSSHLGAIVLALQNLETRADANVLDRLGQRLAALPLSGDSRDRLRALLGRSLPGGGAR